MKLVKRVHGFNIPLEVVKIKDYKRFSLYEVYKLINGERIPLYRKNYTDLEIKNIMSEFYFIKEEVFN